MDDYEFWGDKTVMITSGTGFFENIILNGTRTK